MSTPASSLPRRSLMARYHRWVTQHPFAILALAGLIGIAAAALASRLSLKTAISELLPSEDPGVVTMTKTSKRIGDLSLLLIGIHSPDPKANERYAEALTGELRA